MKTNNTDIKSEQSALLGMFPSVKSFKDFEKDHEISDPAIPMIIRHAFETGVVRENTREAFLQFLAENESDDDCSPPDITFDEVLDSMT
ncbi:MAG: hypothetical protein GY749_48235, partial [Desulfobacteraceae bacterium]|nr:hypothetical protein [Desulfobacteraceae bacterium]